MTMLPQSYSSINILKTNNTLLKNAMKIYKIQVENFRLLKNFSIDVEDPQTIKTMRYSMNIITLEPKVSTGWILGCRVRYAHCSGN